MAQRAQKLSRCTGTLEAHANFHCSFLPDFDPRQRLQLRQQRMLLELMVNRLMLDKLWHGRGDANQHLYQWCKNDTNRRMRKRYFNQS